VLRYKPDYVISIDGMNDVSALLRGPKDYDPWLLGEQETEFDHLANPRPLASVRLFAATWLRNNSVLFRTLQDSMAERLRRRRRHWAATTVMVPDPIRFEDLSPANREQYGISAVQIETYVHTIREMHQVMALDGIADMFILQPEIDVSRKRRTARERSLDEFHRKVDGSLLVYGFQSLYPELSGLMTADAKQYGYPVDTSITWIERTRFQPRSISVFRIASWTSVPALQALIFHPDSHRSLHLTCSGAWEN